MKKLLVIFLILAIAKPAYAFNLIRDDEIETYLKTVARPIFKAANLEPNSIKIYVINDDSLNAFVTDGQKMFIHTALITRAENSNMLSGVIAHETGHISGGHLIKLSGEITNAIIAATIGYALGIGLVIASNNPDVGGAIALGTERYASRSFLKFSREQEEMADSLGLGFLQKNGTSAKGLYDLLNIFSKRQAGFDADPYVQTHPLSKTRLDNIADFVRKHPDLSTKTSDEIEQMHKRVVAKIEGFLGDINQAKKKYENRNDFFAKYAKSIILHRENEFEKSMKIIDELIAKKPDDVYLHELKGQFSFESGNMLQAVKEYEKAAKKLPNSILINTEYAKAMLSVEESHTQDYHKLYKEAERILKKFNTVEPLNLTIWGNLAKAYGKNGKLAESYYALAQFHFLRNDIKKAKTYVELAKEKTSNVILKEKILELQDEIKKKSNKNAEF